MTFLKKTKQLVKFLINFILRKRKRPLEESKLLDEQKETENNSNSTSTAIEEFADDKNSENIEDSQTSEASNTENNEDDSATEGEKKSSPKTP